MKEQLSACVIDACNTLLKEKRCKKDFPSAEELQLALGRLGSTCLEVGVVGLQGHGKSTLVNALVGEQILYSGAEIATDSLVSIEYGPPSCKIIKLGGSHKDSQNHPLEYLKKIGYRGGIAISLNSSIRAFTKSEFLAKGIRIVDTPGADSGLTNDADDALVEKYLNDTQVIIVAMHCTKPGLDKVFELLKRVGRKASDLIVVITAIDMLEEDELDEVMNVTSRQLLTHFGRRVPVFPIAARRCLQASGYGEGQDENLVKLRERIVQISSQIYLTELLRTLNLLGQACVDYENIHTKEVNTCSEVSLRMSEKLDQAQIASQLQIKKIDRACVNLKALKNDALESIEAVLEEQRGLVNLSVTDGSWVRSQSRNTLIGNLSTAILEEVSDFLEEAKGLLLEADIKIVINNKLSTELIVAKTDILVGLAGKIAVDSNPTSRRIAYSDFDRIWNEASSNIHKLIVNTLTVLHDKCILVINSKKDKVKESVDALKYEVSRAELLLSQATEHHWASIEIVNQIKCLSQPARAAVQLLQALETSDCTEVFEMLDADCVLELEVLRSIQRELEYVRNVCPTMGEARNFLAHCGAAMHFNRNGLFDDASRQAIMALGFAESVVEELRVIPLLLQTEVIRQKEGNEAALNHLDNTFAGVELLEQRLALSLLSQRMDRARSLLSQKNGSPCCDRLMSAAVYMCGEESKEVISQEIDGFSLLNSANHQINIEGDLADMAEALRYDSSLERHIVARLSRWAVIDEIEAAHVKEAFGDLEPWEYLMPASLAQLLETFLNPFEMWQKALGGDPIVGN